MGAIERDSYFYYGTTRKIVSIFGAFFNDIYTGRKLTDGTLANMSRVPLSYGPRSKFLARITEDPGLTNKEVAIKLPRMSFEITGIAYDTNSKINSIHRRTFCVEGNENLRDTAYTTAPYVITFELSIFSRTQDDALQILEQILPMFRPEYTVSVKDMEGPGTTIDVPFILSDIGLNDEYEGDFVPTRPIIYTLTFTTRVKYLGSIRRQGVIERTMINFRDPDTKRFLGEKLVGLAEPPKSFISSINPDDFYKITFSEPAVTYQIGENAIGQTSGYAGLVQEIGTDWIIIDKLENMFEYDESYGVFENLIGAVSGENRLIASIEKVEL